MPTPAAEPNRSDEFTTFMRAYQDMVFSTAARLTANDSQAEDIAQDVFVRAFERFAELRRSPTAGGWLKTVTTHLTLNYLTRHRRRWRLFSEMPTARSDEWREANPALPAALAGQVEVSADELLVQFSGEQRRRWVDDALRRLPEHQRLPLVLYHFQELSYEQIAARLRVSLAKVKTDMHRGRLALLAMLQKSGLAPECLAD